MVHVMLCPKGQKGQGAARTAGRGSNITAIIAITMAIAIIIIVIVDVIASIFF